MARLRVLLSAYACGPIEESEAGAGWAFATAAARSHDVHVITRQRFAPAIEAALAADPELARHLHVEYLELSERVMSRKRRPIDVYWYYALWQRAVGRRALALHAERPFDLAHHVTFANDWMPCGLLRLEGVPLVWGPVGGASRMPLRRLAPWLGRRGTLVEVVRPALTGTLRRLYGDPTARRAALVVAQNDEVAHRFRRAARVIVEPNASIRLPAPPEPDGGTAAGRAPVAMFVGRLVAWKGPRLAVAAMAQPALADWTLRIYGDGRERVALQRLAAELGVDDRIEFRGHTPRDEVLAAYSEADVFLFPSMHDQAGWVVAEASASGCPVVCLPLGGPPVLAPPNGHVVSLEGDLVANLADAVVAAAKSGGVRHDRWSPSRLPGLVEAWYAGALGREPSTR